jgi:hypothetical protein
MNWIAGEMISLRGFECACTLCLKHYTTIILVPGEAFYGALTLHDDACYSNTMLPLQLLCRKNVPIVLVDQGALGVSKQQLDCSIGRKTFVGTLVASTNRIASGRLLVLCTTRVSSPTVSRTGHVRSIKPA